MSTVTIKGEELPVKKIFSADYAFSIPYYQRPYAWTTEQAEELLEDLIEAMGPPGESVDETNPYFLGSIVLVKGVGRGAEIVDGQQRLTTLTILLAALRHFFDGEHRKGTTDLLYEAGNPITQTKTRYRLSLRDRDDGFFKRYILEENGLDALSDVTDPLSDSQKNLRDNAMMFMRHIESLALEEKQRLARFIANRCYLVVVSTPDFDSAYRIFSVLNDRGLDLSHSDILKAEIIGTIPTARQREYTEKWEEAESMLGRDRFDDLFAHIRMIHRKAKLRDTTLEEIRKYVRPTEDPVHFIDRQLLPAADAFVEILGQSFQSASAADEINTYIGWLHLIDNGDWTPPAMSFIYRHRQDPPAVLQFLKHLERIAMVFMLLRRNVNQRIERYAHLLRAIEEGSDLYADTSPLQLTPRERAEAAVALEGDVYQHRTVRRPLLLRLDSVLSDGAATYEHNVVTVEHVLPQTPAADSQWLRWFPDEEQREHYTNRLSNLVLLSRRKNSQAANYDFERKKREYFLRGGTSPFALTSQVLQQEAWTPEVLDSRQAYLVGRLKTLWRL